jgi:hypothetical protein
LKRARTALLAALTTACLTAAISDPADARKRRDIDRDASELSEMDFERHAFERDRRSDRRRMQAIPTEAMVPPGWQPESKPADQNWEGQRFRSPDGMGWFAIYRVPAERPVAEHMKSLAFAADDETLTYLRGERSWIAASGFKGSNVFYRKAVLACGGRAWHHIAYEYPVEEKARMDRIVALASEGVTQSRTDCGNETAARRSHETTGRSSERGSR